MGRIFLIELEGSYYRCRFCDSPLALVEDILSRSFNCNKGKAYLFNKVVNVTYGQAEERLMISGLHTVKDLFCCGCGQYVGWVYVRAQDKNQRYKEGTFVLERWRTCDEADNHDSSDTDNS